ncbi:MAG TPA: hypothetical protein VJK29_02360 [Terriglobales bacterium]|nr:hypothetical protein [Terriglobales bacterium]
MARIFLTVLFVVVVGCGSGDHQTVVTISPRPSTVALGTSVTFTAAIQHNRVPLGVNWTLEITSAWSSAGSITVTGPLSVVYTAPPTVPPNPSVTLWTIAQADKYATGSVTFTLQ